MSKEIYDKLCEILTDFENSTDDCTSEDYLSDGEWLDIFYDLCVKIQNDVCN